MNENEKRAQVEVATLELMQAVRALSLAHESLIARTFNQARAYIADVVRHAEDALLYIPEESGD